MYVCLCNPFSDKKVSKLLSSKKDKSTVSEVYSTCSGGEKPNCCQCLETVKSMVKSHNESITA